LAGEKPNPLGWKDAGKEELKADCLRLISRKLDRYETAKLAKKMAENSSKD